MANLIIKKQIRSISLPTRSHPSTSAIEEVLTKINSKCSSNSILKGLKSLEELYKCTDEFLKMGSTQRVLSSNHCERSEFMEEMLDGSLRLMDICSVSRDLMVETHEHVRNVQSCVRRKKVGGGDQSDVVVSSYVVFRKKMKKEAKKLLGSLKNINGGLNSCFVEEDEHFEAVVYSLRRVVSVSVSVLKCFLEFLSGRESGLKSKLASVLKKKKVHEDEEIKNELESVDVAICTNEDDLQKKLEEVEMSIDGFEKNLEGLFRELIRTRASLLNIISQ